MPPVKLYDAGRPNEEVLRFFCHNSRTPRETRADVMAIAAGTAAGAQRVKDICDRFGKDTYLEACDSLLALTRTSIIGLIRQLIPEGECFEFEDYTDHDELGNGPIKLKLAMWREGDSLHLDWTGTDAQVPGPVNFLLNPQKLLRRRAVQGRLRHREGPPFPCRRHHHIPGRPPPHLPVWRGRRQARRGVEEDARQGEWR